VVEADDDEHITCTELRLLPWCDWEVVNWPSQPVMSQWRT